MQVQSDIRTELEQLGSSLASLPRLMPYTVPGGYFEQLPTTIIKELGDELTMTGLPKDNPFDLPVNYFEGVVGAVLKKVNNEQPKPRTISLGRMVRIAAAAVLLLGAGFGVSRLAAPAPASYEQQLSALPDAAVQEYIALTGDDSELQNGSLAMTELPVNELSDEEIQQYLEETNF